MTSRRSALWGSGLVLGAGMGIGNVLSYLVVTLLSRSLGPADFGGYGALTTYGVLLAIPAGAFQVVVASRTQRGGSGPTTALLPALGTGAVLFVATGALSPLLKSLFHLSTLWSLVLLGGILVPMTITGCFQGVLLGRGRLAALSFLYVVTALTRVAAAVAVRLWQLGVAGTFACMLVAAIVTAGVGLMLCSAEVRTLPAHAHRLLRHLARSNLSLAAFVALTNVDVLFARHYLSTHASGGYALASTFGRAVYWGTQFIALLVVPRMSRRNATRTLLLASGVALAIGLVALGIVAAAPRWWITAAGGSAFSEYSHVAVACVVMGIGWALAQVWLFGEMGASSGALGVLTWLVVAFECVAIIAHWHRTPMQIVAVATTGALVVATAGLVLTWQRHQRMPRTDAGSVAAIVAAEGP